MCLYEHSGLRTECTCTCGGDFIKINGYEYAGTESVAILQCVSCRAEYSLTSLLRRLPVPASHRKGEQRARHRERTRGT